MLQICFQYIYITNIILKNVFFFFFGTQPLKRLKIDNLAIHIHSINGLIWVCIKDNKFYHGSRTNFDSK